MQAVTSPMAPVFEADVLDEHLRALAGDKPMASFGLKALNDMLGGIYPGQIYALGAAPGKGKTTLTAQEADKLASDGHAVIYVSAELPGHKLLAKSIARLSRGKIALAEIADATEVEHPKHQALVSALAEYRERIAPNLCITGPLSVTDLGCLVGNCIHERAQVPIVFVDYLQLIACGSSTDPFMDERIAIATCVKGLRDISNCYGAPIIALSSTTRNSYSAKKPDLSMFGGSSAVEYSFDAALYLTDDTDKPEFPFVQIKGVPLKLVALKNRYGTLGVAKIEFDGKCACFLDRE